MMYCRDGNITKYDSAGLAGLVVAGTTGEAPLLNQKEKLKLFQTVREAAEDKVLIAGTGAESIGMTLVLTRLFHENEIGSAVFERPAE